MKFILIYGTMMRNYEEMCEVFRAIKSLKIVYTRPASYDVTKKMFKISQIFGNLFWFYLTVCSSYYILGYWLLFNGKNNIASATLNHLPLNSFLKTFIFGFVQLHSICFTFGMMLILSYCMFHFVFSLENLNQVLIEFIRKKNNNKNKSEHIYCVHCEEEIFNQMVYLLNQFLGIKEALTMYNNFIKWRMLSLVVGASTITGSSLVVIMAGRTKETFLYYGLFFSTLLSCFIVAESGEQIKSQSEMIFANIQRQKWYYWSKKNKKMLMMFLLVTQKPLEMNCHGFLVESREMMLKVARIIHVFVTYYRRISASN
uniref:Uncharacterized protein LOC114330471 n=1 Tax=Diabrotica virgifera virgifera TaxID=50390 RepID=A0A6P7FI77_DIAVI